jgi:hypothetical protein
LAARPFEHSGDDEGGTTVSEPERKATTESLFRDVNERIAESAQSFAADEASFVCECGDPTCTERITADLEEYEEVRADATTFLLADGHEDADVERVIERRRSYNIVKKVHRTVVATVRRLDPRAQPA